MTRRIPADAPFSCVAIAVLLVTVLVAGVAPSAVAGGEADVCENYEARGRSTARAADVLEPGDDDQPTICPRRRSIYIDVTTTPGEASRGLAPASEQPPSDARGRWIEAIRVFVQRLGFALRMPS